MEMAVDTNLRPGFYQVCYRWKHLSPHDHNKKENKNKSILISELGPIPLPTSGTKKI